MCAIDNRTEGQRLNAVCLGTPRANDRYAYSDAVNALEADIKTLATVVAKGAHYMWGLK